MTQPTSQPAREQAPQVARRPEAEEQQGTVSLAGVSVTGQHSAERVSQAVADQLVASRAVPRGVAVAAPVLAVPPPAPPVLTGERPVGDGAGPSALLGRHHRLHIGWHSTSVSGANRLARPTPPTGLLLGADVMNQPVTVRFFRAEPTRVVLVGGVWAAQLLAMRALAMGATVVVMTVDPPVWAAFRDRVISPASRLVVLHGEQPGRAVSTVRQPVLVVYDLGTSGPIAPVTIGPWQTDTVVLRRLAASGTPAFQQCDLLVTQRLDAAEAETVQGVLRLVDRDAALLQQMENEMVALIGGGADRYLWLRQTSVERQVLGPPSR